MDNCKKIRLSRRLAKILRHDAEKYNLKIKEDGYVDIKDLFKISDFKCLDLEKLQDIVKINNKNRFTLKQNKHNWYIRANQGHSIKKVVTNKLLKPIFEPCQCIHATTYGKLNLIKKTGLNRMKRNTIHFSEKYPAEYTFEDNVFLDGATSAPSHEVLIFIDMKKAMEDKITFWTSENGVILSEGVNGILDPKYFLSFQDIS